MKKCYNCHAELIDEAMFCPECGSKQKTARVCPHCGCEQDEEVVFCTQCGKKIGAEPVPEVPVTVAVSKPAATPSEVEVPPVQEEPKVPEKTLEELEAEQKSLVTTLYEQNKLDLAYTEACKLYEEFSSNENFLLKEEISDKYVEELTAKFDELLRTEQNSLAMVCVKKALSVKPNDLGLLSRKATVESIGTAKTKKTISRFLIPLVIIAVIGAIGWFVYSIIINKPKEEVAESVVEKKEIVENAPKEINIEEKAEIYKSTDLKIFGLKGQVKSITDENGQTMSFDENGKIQNIKIRVLSEKDDEIVYLDESGYKNTLLFKDELLVKHTVQDDDFVLTETKYTYNMDRDLEKIDVEGEAGVGTGFINDVVYDSNGNWIKRRELQSFGDEYDQPSWTETKRKIIYY